MIHEFCINKDKVFVGRDYTRLIEHWMKKSKRPLQLSNLYIILGLL